MDARGKMVNLSHHAKFRDNRSNRCWDMAIFWFSRWWQSAILRFFKFQNFNNPWVQRVCTLSCQLLRQMVKPLPRCDNGRLPSWICFEWAWPISDKYFMVFIVVHNLAGVGNAVLKICKIECYTSSCLIMPIHAPFRGVFGVKWG